MDLSVLAQEYKIKETSIKPLVPTENGKRTALKELVGEKIIKKYQIWEHFFPDYESVKKVTTKKLQMEGVDFIINEDTFIDLKSDIGPDYGNIIPLEIRQNGVFTMLSNKKTDWLLHIVVDDFKKRAVLIDYQWASKLAHRIAVAQVNHSEIPWPMFLSNNGTGQYIKLDYTSLPPEAKCKVLELK